MTERRKCLNILGLVEGASEDEIRKSYKKLALQYHPDKNDSEDAKGKFQDIGYAYKYLTDGPNSMGGANAHDIGADLLRQMFEQMFHESFGSFGFQMYGGFGVFTAGDSDDYYQSDSDDNRYYGTQERKRRPYQQSYSAGTAQNTGPSVHAPSKKQMKKREKRQRHKDRVNDRKAKEKEDKKSKAHNMYTDDVNPSRRAGKADNVKDTKTDDVTNTGRPTTPVQNPNVISKKQKKKQESDQRKREHEMKQIAADLLARQEREREKQVEREKQAEQKKEEEKENEEILGWFDNGKKSRKTRQKERRRQEEADRMAASLTTTTTTTTTTAAVDDDDDDETKSDISSVTGSQTTDKPLINKGGNNSRYPIPEVKPLRQHIQQQFNKNTDGKNGYKRNGFNSGKSSPCFNLANSKDRNSPKPFINGYQQDRPFINHQNVIPNGSSQLIGQRSQHIVQGHEQYRGQNQQNMFQGQQNGHRNNYDPAFRSTNVARQNNYYRQHSNNSNQDLYQSDEEINCDDNDINILSHQFDRPQNQNGYHNNINRHDFDVRKTGHSQQQFNGYGPHYPRPMYPPRGNFHPGFPERFCHPPPQRPFMRGGHIPRGPYPFPPPRFNMGYPPCYPHENPNMHPPYYGMPGPRPGYDPRFNATHRGFHEQFPDKPSIHTTSNNMSQSNNYNPTISHSANDLHKTIKANRPAYTNNFKVERESTPLDLSDIDSDSRVSSPELDIPPQVPYQYKSKTYTGKLYQHFVNSDMGSRGSLDSLDDFCIDPQPRRGSTSSKCSYDNGTIDAKLNQRPLSSSIDNKKEGVINDYLGVPSGMMTDNIKSYYK